MWGVRGELGEKSCCLRKEFPSSIVYVLRLPRCLWLKIKRSIRINFDVPMNLRENYKEMCVGTFLNWLIFCKFIKLGRKRWRQVWVREERLHWISKLHCSLWNKVFSVVINIFCKVTHHHDRKFHRTQFWCRMASLNACKCQLVHWIPPMSTISRRPLCRWLQNWMWKNCY